ncbi:MAG: lipoyl(octanoyl) transferase LipB [Tatlockia sp.]|jgi:lipoyl(octanoyl) transferase
MIVQHLGLKPYLETWERMKAFTLSRTEQTKDELWLLQHPAVYTQGQAGKPEHILNAMHIPVVQSDRGGQVTYHGPGQLVGYVLMDIARKQLGIRALVSQLEQTIIQVLAHFKINGSIQCGAPGVYVDRKKIASIGLRVKNGCTYHGIALNVSMDLTPFNGINPCGFAKLEMTKISDFISDVTLEEVSDLYAKTFLSHFNP